MNVAIKGHLERGNEVIQLLEMLGGINKLDLIGTTFDSYYYIDDIDNKIRLSVSIYLYDYIIYSLEEFLEKFPYKVGDKVSSKYLKNYKIVKMEWEDTNNRVIYKLQGMGWYNSDELEYYKEETMEDKLEQITFDIPNGYEFFGINDDNQVILAKKQPKYPKTYKECCEYLGLSHCGLTIDLPFNYSSLFISLAQLYISRNAYWKIAGEEMSLGKPWEPDWKNLEQEKHCIWVDVGSITLQNGYRCQHILVFPTEEMRDAFYENFKDLIEQCKKLL